MLTPPGPPPPPAPQGVGGEGGSEGVALGAKRASLSTRSQLLPKRTETLGVELEVIYLYFFSIFHTYINRSD